MATEAAHPEFSRAAFREWLLTLPPDKPVCPPRREHSPRLCPIEAYWLARDSYLPTRAVALMALHADPVLVRKIDGESGNTYCRWSDLLPADVIGFIDEVEGKDG